MFSWDLMVLSSRSNFLVIRVKGWFLIAAAHPDSRRVQEVSLSIILSSSRKGHPEGDVLHITCG